MLIFFNGRSLWLTCLPKKIEVITNVFLKSVLSPSTHFHYFTVGVAVELQYHGAYSTYRMGIDLIDWYSAWGVIQIIHCPFEAVTDIVLVDIPHEAFFIIGRKEIIGATDF